MEYPNLQQTKTTKDVKEFEEQMEKLRTMGLERQTLEFLKTTYWGKIYAWIYLFLGIISLFIYILVFDLGVFLSIVLGIITWLVISFTSDKILVKHNALINN